MPVNLERTISMALADMFLLIEGQKTGKISGESKDAVYPGQIQILDWSWGMSSSASMAGTSATNRTALSELSIVKNVDTASTALMSVMRSNEVIKKGVITVRKAGNNPLDYFQIIIEKGRITAYAVGSQTGPVLTEKLSIAFEKIEVHYSAQDDTGGKKATSTFSAQVTNN
jgi:type VI secretion system secreted protein Hcp